MTHTRSNAKITSKVIEKAIEIQESGIAWNSDLKFLKNPEGYPNVADIRWLYERFPSIVGLKEDGIKNEHFAVWNRPAALPNTLKLWGIIDDDLAAGEELDLTVDNYFPLSQGDMTKSLILVQKGMLGGRSDALGLALMVIGAVGFACGVIVLAAHQVGSKKVLSSPETVELPSMP